MSDLLRVTMVSHACLKIQGKFGTLLCDPWILNEPVYNFTTWKFPAAVIPPDELLKDIDYLFITHSHEDHFHVPSINKIRRDVQIILPEYTNHPSLRAFTVERVLRGLGFFNIRKIKPWESFWLGNNIPFTHIPSASTRTHDWENAGFVIEHGDCTLLNMNDNLSDRDLCFRIVERFGRKIDIAFIQSAGVTMYPACFFMSEDEMKKEAAKRKVALEDQRRMLDWIKPKRVVPFAGDFCWLDDLYSCGNWASRVTPKFFEDFVKENYPGTECVTMSPSDCWDIKNGIKRNHPAIDWENYLGEIQKVKTKFSPKIKKIRDWINDSSKENLLERSKQHLAIVEKWITRDYIDFEAVFKISIEGKNSNFGFYFKSSLNEGFQIKWGLDRNIAVDQILHVPEDIWAAILDGKLTFDIIQWTAKAEQPNGYRSDMGRFWFWLEYHVDLNSKNPQFILEPKLYPHIDNPVRPNLGVFESENDWDMSWLKK